MTSLNGSDLVPGTLIKDRYLIQSCIGTGASSTVYRAVDTQIASLPIAIKVFNQTFMKLPQFSEVYSRELQASFAVDHENVVRLYDMIRTKTLVALVTELIDGITLTDYAEQFNNRLPDAMVRKIMLAVLRGLSAIHGRGLIHRDVKPDNILISRDGSIKINDFGVAKSESASSKGSSGNLNVSGTPYYTSPEYLEHGRYDARSDLHSVGIIAFELLSGRELFDTSSPAGFLVSKVEAEIPKLLGLAPKCNSDLAAIVDRLLKKPPQDRYQDANSAIQALEKVPLSGASTNNFFVDNQGEQEDHLEYVTMRKDRLDVPLTQGKPRKRRYRILKSGIILYPLAALGVYLLISYTNLLSWLENSLK